MPDTNKMIENIPSKKVLHKELGEQSKLKSYYKRR